MVLNLFNVVFRHVFSMVSVIITGMPHSLKQTSKKKKQRTFCIW